METLRCGKRVYPNDRWGAFHPHQCHRKVWKDGFCKQHHPSIEEARQLAKEMKWEKEREERKRNDPYLLLQKANKRIEELEAENTELKRKLAVSEEIRIAEKKILIEEIEKNTKLRGQ